jgi:hypothetical protein
VASLERGGRRWSSAAAGDGDPQWMEHGSLGLADLVRSGWPGKSAAGDRGHGVLSHEYSQTDRTRKNRIGIYITSGRWVIFLPKSS